MAPAKKKRLPNDFEELLKAGDLPALQAIFDGCHVDARGGYAKQTALAFDECPDELARWLVARGADLRAADTWGNTPLHSRARSWRGRIDILLELGADVNAAEASIGTPLHAAASSKNVENAAKLMAHGADPNARNRDGLTPLELALQGCENARLEPMAPLARLFLERGAQRTPAMSKYVVEIGKRFEFHRANFAPEHEGAASAALEALYALFGVDPVPRRSMHDGTSPITVTTTRWQQQHAELWDFLVPGKGPAATVQGEVIRISGRLGHEVEGNGGCNWDDDFRTMARAFMALVQTGTPPDESKLERARAAIHALLPRGEGDTSPLAEVAVAWVLHNPVPVPLTQPTYRR